MLVSTLQRLATTCVRHRRAVILTWLLAVVGCVFAASAWGGEFAGGGRVEGSDSDAAYGLYLAHFPHDPAGSALMVFENDRGLAAASVAVDAFLARLELLPGVEATTSPLAPGNVSADGRVGIANVTFDTKDPSVIDRISAEAVRFREAGTAVDFSSNWFQKGGVPVTEGYGLLAAMVILLIAFGSVVAMGLPLVTAVAGITIGLAGVELWAAFVPTPAFTVQVASMVGIGVGIDYALFIVTRYREELRRFGDPHDAIAEAVGTAGRAVLFAGLTVMISLLGMFLMGMPFLYGLALGTSTSVLVAVIAALTLLPALPALLGVVGHRIDRLSVHRRVVRATETR